MGSHEVEYVDTPKGWITWCSMCNAKTPARIRVRYYLVLCNECSKEYFEGTMGWSHYRDAYNRERDW